MDDAEAGRVLNEITVSYTVRELLSRIEERLVRMETRTEKVALVSDLEAVYVKMSNETNALAKKVDELESARDKLVGFAFAVGALSGGAAGWIANLIGT